jgi:hypothetical protein
MSTLARMHGKPRRGRRRFGDGSAGYPRQKHNWYVEEEAAVEALVANEPFTGAIHDPACGKGTIPTVFARHGYAVSGSDKVDRGYGAGGIDYLSATPQSFDNIVSNPPYFKEEGLIERFILKAIAESADKVAMFLRGSFREGIDRHRDLWAPHPPRRIWDFTWRVCCPPGDADVERKGGMMHFAWFVWEPGWRGPGYEGRWL